jgi:hypothetical protein
LRTRVALFIPFGGALVVTCGLWLLVGVIDPPAIIAERLGLPGPIASVVFWPVTLCLHLVGPGPAMGPIAHPMYEWTPAHEFAVALGLGLSWAFYSGITVAAIWYRRRYR